MAAPTCTTEQFKRLAHELQSAELVAKTLGITDRASHARWRSIENREGIILPRFDRRLNKQTVGLSDNKAVVSIEVTDGVVLVGSDFHIVSQQWTTMQRAFIHFAEKLKPQAIIVNGDVADFAIIGRHASIGWEARPSVKQELDSIQEYLGLLAKAAPAARKVWPLGNHDARFESRLAALVPEYKEVLGIHLKDHFPLWLPCWRCDINPSGDWVIVRHREKGGEHADFRNVVEAGVHMVTGHDHRAGVTLWRTYRGRFFSTRCGFMADSPQDPQFVNYLEAKEPNWHPGFGVFTFKAGRLMPPELVLRERDGVVSFRGEEIEV
jgi:metallophosphoesterase superfamily enzyme